MARPAATTRTRIDEVALTLFVERGFEAVTADEIARACGISRPTLFRYVSRTADLVLDQVVGFGDLTVARLADTPGQPWPALRAALVGCYGDLDPTTPMGRAFAVLAADDGLRAQSGLLARHWRRSLTEALDTRGAGDRLTCEALAGAAIGIVTAAFAAGWTAAELERALAVLNP